MYCDMCVRVVNCVQGTVKHTVVMFCVNCAVFSVQGAMLCVLIFMYCSGYSGQCSVYREQCYL